MKTLKCAIIFLGFILVSLNSFSQINANAELLCGNGRSYINAASGGYYPHVGISGTFLHHIDSSFAIGANIGFRTNIDRFIIKSYQLPILAYARYYINNLSFGLYPEISIGLIICYDKETSNFGFATNSFIGQNISLGIGYKLKKHIDFSMRYEVTSSENNNLIYTGFRVGYWF
jgi:hypothetical protein